MPAPAYDPAATRVFDSELKAATDIENLLFDRVSALGHEAVNAEPSDGRAVSLSNLALSPRELADRADEVARRVRPAPVRIAA